MANPLFTELIGFDDLHDFVLGDLTRFASFQERFEQYYQAVHGEVTVPPFVRSLLFLLLRRLAELRTQGQPPQQQLFLCPKIRPVPKLGPSARGPPENHADAQLRKLAKLPQTSK